MQTHEGTTESPKKRKRLVYLDIIRGTLLAFIVTNHIPYAPKFIDVFTGDGALVATAAEGFFLLSGLMVAYLYLPKILSDTRSILKKVWKRALTLYIISIATTVVFTLAALFVHTDPTGGSLYGGSLFSLDFLRNLLSFHYVYGWADFLSRYAVFMLFAPAALFLMAYKKTYILIIISILLWFLSPVIGMAQFSAWQILFFGFFEFRNLLPQDKMNTLSKSFPFEPL